MDLDWLVGAAEVSEPVVVEQAIRIFRLIIEAQQSGQTVVFRDSQSGKLEELLLL